MCIYDGFPGHIYKTQLVYWAPSFMFHVEKKTKNFYISYMATHKSTNDWELLCLSYDLLVPSSHMTTNKSTNDGSFYASHMTYLY